MSKPLSIPDSAALRAIRARHTRDIERLRTDRSEDVGINAHADRGALLALLDDIITQAHEGCFIEHECPALFACTYIVAQTCETEETRRV